MKLKTKFQNKDFELGEVVDANYYRGADRIRVNVFAHDKFYDYYYNSIKGFTDHWEDAPEEKHYFISNNGQIHEECGHDRYREERQEMGNDFPTEEEAKKAVEKLKAWKRLKDTGCKPVMWRWKQDYPNDACYVGVVLKCQFDSGVHDKELDLLFGGEE